MAEFVFDPDARPGIGAKEAAKARPTEAPQQDVNPSPNIGVSVTESHSTTRGTASARGQPNRWRGVRRRTHPPPRRKAHCRQGPRPRSPCHAGHKSFSFSRRPPLISHAQRVHLRRWVQPFIRPLI